MAGHGQEKSRKRKREREGNREEAISRRKWSHHRCPGYACGFCRERLHGCSGLLTWSIMGTVEYGCMLAETNRVRVTRGLLLGYRDG